MDSSADPISEALLRQVSGLRALAASMLGDEHLAEDVVQEAFVAALQKPQSSTGAVWERRGDAFGAWLRAATRFIALRKSRGRTRRAQREGLAAELDGPECTLDFVQRENLLRDVVDAIQSLPEHLRSCVLLRYFEGKRPRAIAEQLQLPIPTVHTRLNRALQLLRQKLEAQHGHGATWAFGSLLGIQRKEATLAQPSVALPEVAVMGAKVKVVGVVAATLGLSLWVWNDAWFQGGASSAAAPSNGVSHSAASAATEPIETSEFVSVQGQRSSVPVAVPSPEAGTDSKSEPEQVAEDLAPYHQAPVGFHVTGIVLDPHGNPVPDAVVYSSPMGSWVEPILTTDELGEFELDAKYGWAHLSARAGGFGPSAQQILRKNPGDEVRIELRLTEIGSSLAGQVWDLNGKPAAGARVYFGPTKSNASAQFGAFVTAQSSASEVVLTADENGRFRFVGLPVGTYRVQAHHENSATWSREVHLKRDREQLLEIFLEGGASVEGWITSEGGEPASGVTVGYGGMGQFERRYGRSDEDGYYKLEGLNVGEIELHASRGGQTGASAVLRTQIEQVTTWSPVLPAETKLTGIVVRPDGSPLVGARLWVTTMEWNGIWSRHETSDSNGEFLIPACPNEPLSVRVWAPGFDFQSTPASVALENVLAEDGRLVVELGDELLPTATLKGRVLDFSGSTLQSVEIYSSKVSEEGLTFDQPQMAKYLGDGSFSLGPMPPGKYAVRVQDESMGFIELWRGMVSENSHVDLGHFRLPQPGTLLLSLEGVEVGTEVSLHLHERERQYPMLWEHPVLGPGPHAIELWPGKLAVSSGFGRPGVHEDFEIHSGQTSEVSLKLN